MREPDEHEVMRNISRPLLEVIEKSLEQIGSNLSKNRDVEARLRRAVENALAYVKAAMKKEQVNDEREETEKKQEEHEISDIIKLLEKIKDLFENHSKRFIEIFELDEIERKAFDEIQNDLKKFKKMETKVEIMHNDKKINALRGNYHDLERDDPEKALKIKEGFIDKIISRLEKDMTGLIVKHKATKERVSARLREIFQELNEEEKIFTDIGIRINNFCEEMSHHYPGMKQFLKNISQQLGGHIANHFWQIKDQTKTVEESEKLFNSIIDDIVKRINSLIAQANKLNAKDFATSREVYEHRIVTQTDELVEYIDKYVEAIRSKGELNRKITLYQVCEKIKEASENIDSIAEEIESYINEWKSFMKSMEDKNFHFSS